MGSGLSVASPAVEVRAAKGASQRLGPAWIPWVVWAIGAATTWAAARLEADGHWWWAGRVGFDSGIYLAVAEEGYILGRAHEAAFPGYALAIRWMAAATGWSTMDAAVAVSVLCGLVVVQVCWRWLHALGLRGRAAALALALTAWCPPAFVLYGVAYSDGLLLALVLSTMLAIERDRWLLAGVLGALATATRPNSLALVAAMLVWALVRLGAWEPGGWNGLRGWRRPIDLARLQPRHLSVLLVPLGVVAYGIWLVGHAGSFTYFADLQTDVYGHSPFWHPYTWLKLPVWKDTVSGWPDVVHEVASLLAHLGILLSLPRIARRLDLGYAALVAGLLATSWAANYAFAPVRYLLPAIPVVAAAWAPALAERPRLAAGSVGLSLALMVAMAAGFAGAFDLIW